MKKIIGILLIILVVNSIAFASFSDVGSNNYIEAIDSLVKEGIINGYDDNTFRPGNNITRAEMIKILVKATGASKAENSKFDDVPDNHWAIDYINIGVANGYIKGDGNGKFRPEDNVTYGEVVTMLIRGAKYEKKALEINKQWPENYMEFAETIGLFDGYKGNDLVSVGKARRDSVALMTYNMLKQRASILPIDNKTQPEEDTTPAEKEDNTTPQKIDTKILYTGIVTSVYKKNGYKYAEVIDYENNKNELRLYSKSQEPTKNSFIIFNLRSNGEMNLRKELKLDDLTEGFKLITKVDHKLVLLDGYDKMLDLGLKEYELDDLTLKLEKYKFIVITYDINENEFVEYSLFDKDDVKLQKEDKIRFDTGDVHVCFVIREI